jgi:hypothetical protein
MSKVYDEITPELIAWIGQQHMFFVATAPSGADGHVNCSPKGLDSFRILGPRSVAYLDLTGSGAETIAHLRDNGRIVFMFCAFRGPPNIVRLHGRAEVLTADSAGWTELRPQFTDQPGARAIIRADISRISDSCGYAVPVYEHVEDRRALNLWAQKRDAEELEAYRRQKNAISIDGLPAWLGEPSPGGDA